MFHLVDLPFREDWADFGGPFTAFRSPQTLSKGKKQLVDESPAAYRTKVEERCEVRQLFPAPGRGSLPLPAGLKEPLLEAMPGLKDLPGGHGFDGSLRAPTEVYKGGETAGLARLKVRGAHASNTLPQCWLSSSLPFSSALGVILILQPLL